MVFKVPGVAIKESQIFWTVKFRELKELTQNTSEYIRVFKATELPRLA